MLRQAEVKTQTWTSNPKGTPKAKPINRAKVQGMKNQAVLFKPLNLLECNGWQDFAMNKHP